MYNIDPMWSILYSGKFTCTWKKWRKKSSGHGASRCRRYRNRPSTFHLGNCSGCSKTILRRSSDNLYNRQPRTGRNKWNYRTSGKYRRAAFALTSVRNRVSRSFIKMYPRRAWGGNRNKILMGINRERGVPRSSIYKMITSERTIGRSYVITVTCAESNFNYQETVFLES